ITIPIISSPAGILMTTQYAQVQPNTMLVGIDEMSQLDTYWSETGGCCEHEVILQSTIRTDKTTKTIPFWDAFVSRYGSEPYYTAVGSYDAMYLLLEGISEAQSFDSAAIIPYLEALTTENPLEAASGNIAFTSSHDLFEGYNSGTGTIYSVALVVQWQADGAKECISTGTLIYPNSIVTAPLTIPPWGINHT
ncbi:MAG: hypothetical protein ACFFEU_14850, partial [Candidatus Thorarchaeota archaeon]